MATVQAELRAGLRSLDHATVPSVDLVVDLEFYEQYLGARLLERTPGHRRARGETSPFVNLAVRTRKQNRAPIFFTVMAGIRGFGLFLQPEYLPAPARMQEGPRYGFAVAGNALDAAARVLSENGIEFEGPVSHEPESRIAQSIYLRDPSGNSVELCSPRSGPEPAVPISGIPAMIPLARMFHAAFDVVDLDRSEDFYVQGLGLQFAYRGTTSDGLEKSVLHMPSGQVVTLQHVPEMTERGAWKKTGKCHCAFLVEWEHWGAIEKELARRQVELLPDHVANDGDRADELNIYISDPDGNLLQITTPDA